MTERNKTLLFTLLAGLFLMTATDAFAGEKKKKVREKRNPFALQTIRMTDRERKKQDDRTVYTGGAYVYQAAPIQQDMVLIPRGMVSMGDRNDSIWGFNAPSRQVTVEDFLLDATEVTNAMYHEFIRDVCDSIIAQRLKDPQYGGNINNVRASLYITNEITNVKTLDADQIIYFYQTYDYMKAAQYDSRKDRYDLEVTKDTAYLDANGNLVCEKKTMPYRGHKDFINTYGALILPDTACWINDFPGADNEMYLRYYFSHPEYKNYPVVGVTWEQAQAFCAWRTAREKKALGELYGDRQPYRLPTEAEWEHAARGEENARFPWINQHEAGRGRFYANFMPDDGNFADDGNLITCRVATFLPNSYGLYDMAGNVAEWCYTAYTNTGVLAMNNVNPHHDANGKETQDNRKIVRGGSWKDAERFVQSTWRVAEEKDASHCWIGFRCARSIATTMTGKVVYIKNANRINKKGNRKQL